MPPSPYDINHPQNATELAELKSRLGNLEGRTEALERALNTLVNELNSKNSLRREALEKALNTIVNELNSNNLQIPTIPNIMNREDQVNTRKNSNELISIEEEQKRMAGERLQTEENKVSKTGYITGIPS